MTGAPARWATVHEQHSPNGTRQHWQVRTLTGAAIGRKFASREAAEQHAAGVRVHHGPILAAAIGATRLEFHAGAGRAAREQISKAIEASWKLTERRRAAQAPNPPAKRSRRPRAPLRPSQVIDSALTTAAAEFKDRTPIPTTTQEPPPMETTPTPEPKAARRSQRRKPYSAAFRAAVLEEIEGGEPITEVARRFDITPRSIRDWIQKAERETSRTADQSVTHLHSVAPAPQPVVDTEALVADLRRQVVRLTVERDVLLDALVVARGAA